MNDGGPTPDGITPVEGWRMWRIQPRGKWWWPYPPLLTSPYMGTVWSPRYRLQATHVERWICEEVPKGPYPCDDRLCLCGIHAWREAQSLWEHAQNLIRERGRWVCGTVNLWGRVVVGEIGYRAQYAVPTRLWCIPGMDARLTERAAALYDIPWGEKKL